MAASTLNERHGGSQARSGSAMPTFVRNHQRLRKMAAIGRPGRFADIAAAITFGRSFFPWVTIPGTFMPESRCSPPVTSIAAAARRTEPGLDSVPGATRSPSPQAPASARSVLDQATGGCARQPRSDGAEDAHGPRAAHPDRMDGAIRLRADRTVDPRPVASPRRHDRGHGARGRCIRTIEGIDCRNSSGGLDRAPGGTWKPVARETACTRRGRAGSRRGPRSRLRGSLRRVLVAVRPRSRIRGARSPRAPCESASATARSTTRSAFSGPSRVTRSARSWRQHARELRRGKLLAWMGRYRMGGPAAPGRVGPRPAPLGRGSGRWVAGARSEPVPRSAWRRISARKTSVATGISRRSAAASA